MTLAEFLYPVCHAVRVHGPSVILREHESLIDIVVVEPYPLFVLPSLILAEKLHRLRGKHYIAVGCRRFRGILIDSPVRAVKDVVADMYLALLKVNFVPL